MANMRVLSRFDANKCRNTDLKSLVSFRESALMCRSHLSSHYDRYKLMVGLTSIVASFRPGLYLPSAPPPPRRKCETMYGQSCGAHQLPPPRRLCVNRVEFCLLYWKKTMVSFEGCRCVALALGGDASMVKAIFFA